MAGETFLPIINWVNISEDFFSLKRGVNPVRNSSGALNPVRDLSLNGINPAGIILKSNPAAEQRGIISNGVNNCLIKRLRGSMVADLACRITEFDDSSHVFIIDGNNNPANSIEDEDVLDIRILLHRFEDILHLILVFR